MHCHDCQSFHRNNSIKLPIFLSIHISIKLRPLDVCEKFIKCRLGIAQGFKSQRPCCSKRFLSPPGIIPARCINNLDFVWHDLFNAKPDLMASLGLPTFPNLARCMCRVMTKIYFLRLDENDLGQIIDGLQVREESWRRTADYFRSGNIPDDSFQIEECNGEHEANHMALFYARILRNLVRQRDEQRSSESEVYLQGKADGQANLTQRILANWQTLSRMGPVDLHRRLLQLSDEICDD